MSAAREQVLARVRAALGEAPAPVPPVARRYRRRGPAGAAALDLLRGRVADHGASVHRCRAAELEERLAARCAAQGVGRLALAAGAPWRPEGVELLLDRPPIPAAQLDRLDGALTGCALAIAETGTLVLDGSPACGRRALTLVPDLHLCVLAAADVLGSVPEAIAALGPLAAAGRPLTFVSGPSATSDIELERVEGVHGPRRLELFLVEG